MDGQSPMKEEHIRLHTALPGVIAVPCQIRSTKTTDTSIDLAVNTGHLYKSGYVQTGWNTNVSGTGTHYELGGAYSTDAELLLYAEWRAIDKAPGGVKNGLTSWYKADSGASHTSGAGATDGQSVTEWEDAILGFLPLQTTTLLRDQYTTLAVSTLIHT